MTTLDFIMAICAAPADDAPRLAMADWLEEQGKTERAEFIRCQVKRAAILASLCQKCNRTGRWRSGVGFEHERICTACWHTWEPRDEQANALYRRELELAKFLCGTLDAIGSLIGVRPCTAQLKQEGPQWTLAVGLRTKTTLDTEILFRRGFVEVLTLPARDWLTHSDALTWRLGQKCRKCRGLKECWATSGLYDGIPIGRCPICAGTGERPCPPTAQPIRSVTFTTEPQLWLGEEGLLLRRGNGRSVRAGGVGIHDARIRLLAAEWPGIDFSLPSGV